MHPNLEVQAVAFDDTEGDNNKSRAMSIRKFKENFFYAFKVIIQVEQICAISRPLRESSVDYKNRLNESIQNHGFDHNLGLLVVPIELQTQNSRKDTASLFVDKEG